MAYEVIITGIIHKNSIGEVENELAKINKLIDIENVKLTTPVNQLKFSYKK